MQHRRYGYFAAAAMAAVLALSACSDSGGDTEASATTSSAEAPSSSSVGAQAHNDADVVFAQGMIPHHQQAVEMSDMLVAKRGIDPQVMALANEIKAAQAPEIEQLQSWLDQWGAPAASTTTPPSSMPGHNMPGHDMSGGGDMPAMGGSGHGMMSEADMAALESAQGAEASRLFLTQMIEHHKGAITMAQQEIDGGQYPPAVQLARDIVSSQQQEVATMQGLVDAM
jgi:uncharacterized protein (DUF305 family)